MLILLHLPHLSLPLPLLLSHIKVKETMSNILLVMRVLTKANSLPRSCSCVCAQVYTNIICKSGGREPREREIKFAWFLHLVAKLLGKGRWRWSWRDHAECCWKRLAWYKLFYYAKCSALLGMTFQFAVRHYPYSPSLPLENIAMSTRTLSEIIVY